MNCMAKILHQIAYFFQNMIHFSSNIFVQIQELLLLIHNINEITFSKETNKKEK